MSPHWLPLHVKDYRADTAHLNAAEHGAYLLLIMHYWQHGGLPDDDRLLARIACMAPAEWKRARPVIVAFFGPEWRHKRIDKELQRAADLTEKRRGAANKRHHKADAPAPPTADQDRPNGHANAPAFASANDVHSGCKSIHNTQTQEQKQEREEPPVAGVQSATPARAPPRKPSRIPDDFVLTPKLFEFALSQGLSHDDAHREFDQFRDHWLQSNLPSSVKRDWDAAWRTWVRKALAGGGMGRPGGNSRGNGHAAGSILGAYQRAARNVSLLDKNAGWRPN